MNSHLKIFAVVAAMALVIPASAIAKRPEDKPVRGHKHGQSEKQRQNKEKKPKLSTVNVGGTVESNDGTTMTVLVARASGHARACKEATLSFDLTDARFHTADNNASGGMDAGDFDVGHVVKVRAKVARTKGRKTVCTVEGSIPAKAVHNRTTPQVEETDEEETIGEDELGDDEKVVDDEEGLDDEELLDEEKDLDEEQDFLDDETGDV